MRYAWIIDKDYLASEGDNEAGTVGPRSAPGWMIDCLRGDGGLKFRMYDDDGELYYAGRFMDGETTDTKSLGDEAFGPLDDFGAPNAGCTEIRYLTDGRWVTL